MNKQENGTIRSAPIPNALMALGIPIMIGMLINALYNLVDAYFVGGLGETQMGAISIVFPLGQVVVGLGLMFGNGAASYLSRLLGRGDKGTANKVASTALYSSVFIGAVIIILAAIFLKPILAMLGATDTIMPYALAYASIYVISSIFNVFNVTMNNIVTSEGAAKTTMCALLLGAVLNIGMDPVFIYTLDMGVAGAAIATAISQFVSTLVYLSYMLRKKSAFTFRVREFALNGQMMTEILKIGVPTLTFQLLASLSIALVNRAAMDYGDAVIAGMGAVTRITSMGTLVVFGFLKGFQPIAGFTAGRRSLTVCGSDQNIDPVVNNFLCGCRLFDGFAVHADYFTVYRWKRRNDFRRFKILDGKWPFLLPIRVLYGVFFPVPCSWQRHGRIYPRSLQTGDLLCPCHFDPSDGMRYQRDTLRPARRGCAFSDHHRIYGGPSSQGTADGRESSSKLKKAA